MAAKKKKKKSTKKKRAKKKTKEELLLSPDLLRAKRKLERFRELIEGKPREVVERVSTHIKGMDELLHGGLVKNSTVVIAGGPGTGKTILTLEYCYRGALNGESTLFISTSESVEKIREHAKSLGWDLDKVKKNLYISFYSPYEFKEIIKSEGLSIMDFVESKGITKVALDSVTPISLALSTKQEENDFIYRFFNLFYKMDATSLLTIEHTNSDFTRWEFMADGIIKLHYYAREDIRVRGMEVVKMRDTSHVERVVPYLISREGILVFPKSSVFV